MQPRTVTIKIPEPHYTLFNATRSGLPEVIVVNDALLSFPHSDVFAWHLCVTLEAKDLIENGMPSEEESGLLFEIGDEIEEVVLAGARPSDWQHCSDGLIWSSQRLQLLASLQSHADRILACHGTPTLFAALNTLDGRVISMCQPRHRHGEWLKFLRLIDRRTPKHLSLHLL